MARFLIVTTENASVADIIGRNNILRQLPEGITLPTKGGKKP